MIIFGEEVIKTVDPSEWPVVDCLLAWYSTGFPLEAVERYVQLRKPFQINTVSSQRVLLNRRRVYERCQEFDIPTARHVFILRGDDIEIEKGENEPSFEEFEDEIVVGGVRLHKPFVEKPLDAEEHQKPPPSGA